MGTEELIGEQRQRVLTLVVVVTASGILLTLLLTAISAAQASARRMQSSNNLKQLALGFANYNSTHNKLPIGADFDARGPKHGWYTRIYPYLEASSLYNRIDMRLAWDHPRNDYLFHQSQCCGINPSIDVRVTSEGYGLTHYLANPNLIHCDSSVKLDELTSPASATWIVSEIFQDYQPWGYPFNWRRLERIADEQRNRKQRWHTGFQLANVDASVTFLSFDVDPSVLQELDAAVPAVAPELAALPTRTFASQYGLSYEQELPVDSPPFPGSDWGKGHYRNVVFSRDGQAADTMEFTYAVGFTDENLTKQSERYPELRVVILRGKLTDAVALNLAKLKKLEILATEGSELSEVGLSAMAKLTQLREVIGLSDIDTMQLSGLLTDCQFLFPTAD